ncbi:hypothetical protein QYF61_027594 [Mycteria americana]|uniref:Uncharacterized protein n=1 Tax=Mycteria americana TaxID=33587 RepID=A0AAN7MQ92_MYCAM|nr:hypothetical protein QYF61_027594 [Mycteria americana]
MMRQAVPLQAMEVNGGTDIHLQPMEDPTPEQVDVPKGGCDQVESPCWALLPAVSWQDLCTYGERSPHWSRFAGRTCEPVGDPHWSSLFLKNCSPWEGPTLEKFVEDCLLWEGPHAGAGEECKWTTAKQDIQYLRELAVVQNIYSDLNNNQGSKDPDEVQCTQAMWQRLVQNTSVFYTNTLAIMD